MSFSDMTYSVKGYTCFYTEGSRLITFLDDKFRSFIDDSDYDEFHIPALIDGDVLEKCGYFASFPHHLTVAAFIRSECYEDVINERIVKNEYLETSNKYFTPAACLHIYPMLDGNEQMHNKIITTKARVYRFEEEKFKDLTRLWDFTVREIVFVGDREYVENMLRVIRGKALVFAESISRDARLASASDCFYPSKKNIIQSRIQKVNSLKLELTIPIRDEKVAIASFNFHGTHFSRPFNFDNKGQIVTGCVGFGLERWFAACLEHGYKI